MELKRSLIYYCMCSKAFGIYKVVFERKICAKSPASGFVLNDIDHPFVFVVLPRRQISLLSHFDHSYLYEEVSNLVAQNASLDIIENKLSHIIDIIHAYEHDMFTINNVIQSVIFMCVAIPCFILLHHILRNYFYFFLQVPVKRILPLPCFSRLHIKDNVLELDYYLHDVFVSFSDKDSDFVSVELIPFLEESCNVKVCHPDRDMHSGQTQFSLYKEHITKSRYIIIILSQGYKEDRMCQNLQLEHIILPLLYEEKRDRQEMLFVLYDEGAVFPNILRWNFEVEKLDWRRNCSQERKLDIVKRWLASLTSK